MDVATKSGRGKCNERTMDSHAEALGACRGVEGPVNLIAPFSSQCTVIAGGEG